MSPPLRTKSDIRIDSADRWWFKDELMINEAILSYFKKNLRRENDGAYYIINTWGEKTEHSYIQSVQGFPISVVGLYLEEDPPRLRLDSDETIEIAPDQLRVFDEQTIGLVLPERNVPARFNGGAMAALAPFLDMDGDRVRLQLPKGTIELKPGVREELFIVPSLD